MQQFAPNILNFEGRPVRFVQTANETPWFHAGDVCAVLGYANPSKSLADHVDPEDLTKRDTPTNGGVQQVLHLNESGLYALTFGSTKPEARRFKRWVTSEVLPTLRRQGEYRHRPQPAEEAIRQQSAAALPTGPRTRYELGKKLAHLRADLTPAAYKARLAALDCSPRYANTLILFYQSCKAHPGLAGWAARNFSKAMLLFRSLSEGQLRAIERDCEESVTGLSAWSEASYSVIEKIHAEQAEALLEGRDPTAETLQ